MNQVIFSNETKINLFAFDGRVYVRRKVGQRYNKKKFKPTVKHGGGSIMIWACSLSADVENICIIDGLMNSEIYFRIIDTHLAPSVKKIKLKNYILQQDNDPKHTINCTRDHLSDKKILTSDWPAQSPDMNPIENLWYILKVEVEKGKPKNIKELKKCVKEEWNKIDLDACKKFLKSMNSRCNELLRVKGEHTKF